jgi:ABC-type uncharacterized transport system substrate-binding protein
MNFSLHASAIVLAACLAASALAADAQPSSKVPRIGFLGPRVSGDDPRVENLRQFHEGLRELGYVDGKNITIEWRLADTYEHYPVLAAELVRLNVDVLVTPNTPAALALKRATTAIPIVFTSIADPVGSGLVTSLARPGGNLTGLSNMLPDLGAKRLELLKEAVPKVTRVAILFNASNPGHARAAREVEDAAPALRVQLQPLDVRGPHDLERSFSEMGKKHAGALLVLQDAFFLNHRLRIADFARKSRLPTMYDAREFVDVGGLISYGPSRSDLFRRVALYIDKILKGAKPYDLPVEQPTKFELIVNLKTAKALGLALPRSLLSRVDQVIE